MQGEERGSSRIPGHGTQVELARHGSRRSDIESFRSAYKNEGGGRTSGACFSCHPGSEVFEVGTGSGRCMRRYVPVSASILVIAAPTTRGALCGGTDHVCTAFLSPGIRPSPGTSSRFQPYLRPSYDESAARSSKESNRGRIEKEACMDSKWNWLIDSPWLRATINTAALAIWIALTVGILELASKY